MARRLAIRRSRARCSFWCKHLRTLPIPLPDSNVVEFALPSDGSDSLFSSQCQRMGRREELDQYRNPYLPL